MRTFLISVLAHISQHLVHTSVRSRISVCSAACSSAWQSHTITIPRLLSNICIMCLDLRPKSSVIMCLDLRPGAHKHCQVSRSLCPYYRLYFEWVIPVLRCVIFYFSREWTRYILKSRVVTDFHFENELSHWKSNTILSHFIIWLDRSFVWEHLKKSWFVCVMCSYFVTIYMIGSNKQYFELKEDRQFQ